MVLAYIETYNFDASEQADFKIDYRDSRGEVNFVVSVQIFERNNYSSPVFETMIVNLRVLELAPNTLENGKDYRIRTKLNDQSWSPMEAFSCRTTGQVGVNVDPIIQTSEFSVDVEWNQVENDLPYQIKASLLENGKPPLIITKTIEDSVPNRGGVLRVSQNFLEGSYFLMVKKSNRQDIRIDFEVDENSTPESIAFNIANFLKLRAKLDFTLVGSKILIRTKENLIRVDFETNASFLELESLELNLPTFSFDRPITTTKTLEIMVEITSQHGIVATETVETQLDLFVKVVEGQVNVKRFLELGLNFFELHLLTENLSQISQIQLKRRELYKRGTQLGLNESYYDNVVADLVSPNETDYAEFLLGDIQNYKDDSEENSDWKVVSVCENFSIGEKGIFVDKLINSEAHYEYYFNLLLKDGRSVGLTSLILTQHSLPKLRDPEVGEIVKGTIVQVNPNPFEGDFIMDSTDEFKILYNRELSNIAANTSIRHQPLLNSKKPAIVRGEQEFKTGQLAFDIYTNDTLLEYKLFGRNQVLLLSRVEKFLFNGRNKLFRLRDGESMIVQITDSPTIEFLNEKSSLIRINFSFVEVKEKNEFEEFIDRR